MSERPEFLSAEVAALMTRTESAGKVESKSLMISTEPVGSVEPRSATWLVEMGLPTLSAEFEAEFFVGERSFELV